MTSAPPSVFYIADFISPAEERTLLTDISRTPGPRWTQLANRRLQNWGGVPHPKGMIAETMPDWLQVSISETRERSRLTHSLSSALCRQSQQLPGVWWRHHCKPRPAERVPTWAGHHATPRRPDVLPNHLHHQPRLQHCHQLLQRGVPLTRRVSEVRGQTRDVSVRGASESARAEG